MPDLALGHRVALFGILLVTIGAFGPWAVGMHVQEHVMAPEEAHPYVRWGAEGAGWVLALPAAAALVVLLVPLAPAARAWGACVLLGLCLVLVVLAAGDPLDFPGFGIRVFERYEVSPGWGLGLAAFGCVLGIAAILSDALAARRRAGAA